jgi:hypothetical protein
MLPQNILRYSFIAILLISSFSSFGQEKCGTVRYEQTRKQKHAYKESNEVFEEWLKQKRDLSAATHSFGKTQEEVITIPVVVHIIHRGENTGEDANIPESQILSQLEVLNEDFRRNNTDKNRTRAQFLDVAADAKIEFVLAKRDPEGLPTSGIVRVQGPRQRYGLEHNVELKSLSYWPAEDYLNIWVCPMANQMLGYAQFPISDLEGMEGSSNNRLTDGVVVHYTYFGREGNVHTSSRGRTATHEIGHFLGLRHIWGDGDCSIDDFCEDTPNASAANFNCSPTRSSCGSIDMVENYMDYTDDQCMNIFTICQKERMRTVLANSPRRKSLTTSKALLPPVTANLDAGIRSIDYPIKGVCQSTITPAITLRNYGQTTITSLSITLNLNGQNQETINLNNLALAYLDTYHLNFSNISLIHKGEHKITFTITQVNGVQDENSHNNTAAKTFFVPSSTNLPIKETFTLMPPTWTVENPDDRVTWSIGPAGGNGLNNTAAFMNFYNYDDKSIGELNYLVTPSFDLSSDLSEVELSFLVAYARFPGNNFPEGLIVGVSTDCGNTFQPVFRKFSRNLETTSARSQEFIPNSPNQWRLETIDLSNYIGFDHVQVAFISQNGYGNNLYIDDVEIKAVPLLEVDLNLRNILHPTMVTCNKKPQPLLEIQNAGKQTISSFDIHYSVNGKQMPVIAYEGNPIPSRKTIQYELPEISLNEGQHQIFVKLENPNNTQDDDPGKNERTQDFLIDQVRDLIPLRVTFQDDNPNYQDWTITNAGNGITWELINLSRRNTVVYSNNFNYQGPQQSNFLISPTLDFSLAPQASVAFEVSYASIPNKNDGLRLWVSTDCGSSYSELVYSAFGEDLRVATSSAEWFPQSKDDWRKEFIDLGKFAGQSDVRLAFEAINDGGNNIFLNNIEFFANAPNLPSPKKPNVFSVYPNPLGENKVAKIAFNLSQRQDVDIQIVNTTGNTVYKSRFPNTLNQTYSFNLETLDKGLYIIQASGATLSMSKKIIIQ